MLYMLNEMSILSRNLEKYKELDSYNNEQIQMIKYVLEHKNGLTNYGQLILDDKSLINDISKRKENDLDYFCDTLANDCRISIIDEYTIAFVYKKNSIIAGKKYKNFVFLYLSEINTDNSEYISDCIKVDDNIFIKPYIGYTVPLDD